MVGDGFAGEVGGDKAGAVIQSGAGEDATLVGLGDCFGWDPR